MSKNNAWFLFETCALPKTSARWNAHLGLGRLLKFGTMQLVFLIWENVIIEAGIFFDDYFRLTAGAKSRLTAASV